MQSPSKVVAAILVVEDDPYQAELLQMAIGCLPVVAQAILAVDGLDAIHHLKRLTDGGFERSVAMVLLDLRLPKIHGLDVLAQAQSWGLTDQLPFVVLTSSDNSSERARAIALGARDYVVKPLGFAALQALALRLYDEWMAPSRMVGT